MTKSSANAPKQHDVLSAQAVTDFLRAHPDFFIEHHSLLLDINLPHASGRAVSLVERQVDILRERNVEMRKRMNELLQTARANDELFTKTRSLTLALLEARNLQALNEVLATYMLVDFEADFVCCHLFNSTDPAGGPHDHLRFHAQTGEFTTLLSDAAATCVSLRPEEQEEIFPMSSHETTGSAVLLRLNLAQGEGVLAIGSRDGNRFSNDMDTLFVTYIADVLTKVLDRLL